MISKYKTIFAKVYVPTWPEELLPSQTYVVSNLIEIKYIIETIEISTIEIIEIMERL